MTFFDENYGDFSSSVEGELSTEKEITYFIEEHLKRCPLEIRMTKFLATFVNHYGLLCEFNVIYEILQKMVDQDQIEIVRNPPNTANNKSTTFWSEKESKGRTITIRRLKI